MGQWQQQQQKSNINIVSGPEKEKKCIAEIYLKKNNGWKSPQFGKRHKSTYLIDSQNF